MTDVKLISARVYWEDAIPYLSLKYEYRQGDGIYEYFVPKVEFPLLTDDIPHSFGDDDVTYMHARSAVKMHKGYHNGEYAIDFNNCVRPATNEIKEITISEIEKKLGYKIKIINELEGEN